MKTVKFVMPRISVLALILSIKVETLWEAKSSSEEESDGS